VKQLDVSAEKYRKRSMSSQELAFVQLPPEQAAG
jgi:hypothetical protein